MSLYIPLCKVDAAQRLVYGQIDETPDRADEVFDYASSKPHFVAWSQDMHKTSDGKSYGNVRAMHGKVAAGKLEGIKFDDVAKRIELCARIVDDGEWKKVEQGVYTGFSPGGRYVRRWKEGELTRYTAQPSEISIVDLPCIPSASFTMVKADGAEEQVPFQTGSASYSSDRLGELLGSLDWLWQGAGWEDAWAVDGKPIPEALKSWLLQGSVLVQAVLDNSVAASAKTRGLSKVGARNSKADLELIQAMHDNAVALGAVCPGQTSEDADAGAVADSGDGAAEDADKAAGVGTLTKMQGDLSKLYSERDALKKRLEALEAQPAPGGPVLRAVDKGHDVVLSAEQDEMEKISAMDKGAEKSLALIKLAHRKPMVVRF